MPSVLIVIAEGFEEMEAVAPIDLLRRAEAEVTVASIGKLELTGRNGIHLKADQTLSEVSNRVFDLIVVPGGPAFKLLRNDILLRAMLQGQVAKKKPVGAICAAPTVLKDAGLLADRSYTAHFTVSDELPEIDSSRKVVEDGPVITSRGAGTATEFALALVKRLFGAEKADEIARSICFED
jgi:4-methyl-5(b-hydroxyethyl)-thiazole monophosphate biosynthesis